MTFNEQMRSLVKLRKKRITRIEAARLMEEASRAEPSIIPLSEIEIRNIEAKGKWLDEKTESYIRFMLHEIKLQPLKFKEPKKAVEMASIKSRIKSVLNRQRLITLLFGNDGHQYYLSNIRIQFKDKVTDTVQDIFIPVSAGTLWRSMVKTVADELLKEEREQINRDAAHLEQFIAQGGAISEIQEEGEKNR
jgi:hypothetical protein